MSIQKKVALITGITGQDGSYLAELLLHLGYEVHGIVRPSSTFNRIRIDHLTRNENNLLTLHYGDLTDSISLQNIIKKVRPCELYNLAAQSHVGISFQIPEYSTEVNALSITKILEIVKQENLKTKIYHACTSEMFGSSPPPQSSSTLFKPQSPYAIAKVFSYDICQNYKNAFGMFISCGILFNHESYRRGDNFVTKKIIKSLVEIKNGNRKTFALGNTSVKRDWGWAPEYVVAMWQLLQNPEPKNLLVGTGCSASVDEFLDLSCSILKLDKSKVTETSIRYLRPMEVDSLKADNSEMLKVLGWVPQVDWKKLVEIMIKDEVATRESQIDWHEMLTSRGL